MQNLFYIILVFSTTFSSLAAPLGTFKTKCSNRKFNFKEDANLNTVTILKDYIDESSNTASNNDVTTQVLAEKINTVSKCMGVSPYALATMIKKETNFNQYHPANKNKFYTSSTGAVGLTQMTSIAIKEVHHQLGIQDFFNNISTLDSRISLARTTTINHFKLKVNNCLEQKFKRKFLWSFDDSKFYNSPNTVSSRVPSKGFIQYMDAFVKYKYINDSSRALADTKISRETKEYLKRDPLASLIYGAYILKLKLLVNYYGKCDRELTRSQMKSLYKGAFVHYNGDNKLVNGVKYKYIYGNKASKYLDLLLNTVK